ncbi:LysR family transcriptional regulator [Pseudomonas sp. OTU5201]|uniref:LysR family transcriptional regulator n=1 Tax=Pseudomonas sp. OTU5201 TaxID=3043850 RepID=UPI00313B85E4
MKIHQLRALLAIHECGSIQEASRHLHTSQPSLSRNIKELESELGVQLLVRSNRGITLTPYGQHLVGRARRIVEEVRRAKDEIENLKGSMEGQLRIGVSPVTPSSRLVAVLGRYQRQHPGVTLQIEELRPRLLLAGLREGHLDLALTSHDCSNLEGFHCQQLYQQAAALAVRKGHPRRELGKLSQLRELDWILPDRFEDSPAERMFSDAGLAPPAKVMVCSSLVMYLELAAQTDAVSLWSRRHLCVGSLSEKLEALQIAEPVPPFTCTLISRDPEVLTPEAGALVEDIIYKFYGRRSASADFPLLHIDD